MVNKRWKKVIWIILPALLVVSLVIILSKQRNMHCKEVIVIVEENKDSFLSKEDVLYFLESKYGKLEGRRINSIDVADIERSIHEIPWISDVDAFITLHGTLKIRLQQRKAIARIFDKYGNTGFITDDGTIIPFNHKFKNRLTVVSGDIQDTIKTLIGTNLLDTDNRSILKEIYKTAQFINNDSIYRSLIAQIYVNSKQELELIPAIDNHVIVIGNTDSLDYKFKKLMAFYTRGMSRTGWNTYSTINLKYSNQVICTKK